MKIAECTLGDDTAVVTARFLGGIDFLI